MVRKILFRVLLGVLGSSGIWLLLLISPQLRIVGEKFSGTVSGRILLFFIELTTFAVVSGTFLLAILIAPKWFPKELSGSDEKEITQEDS